jgi:hypothetical protein
MSKYIFAKENFKTVLLHLESFGVDIVTAQLQDDVYILETTDGLPQEQVEHLEMTPL